MYACVYVYYTYTWPEKKGTRIRYIIHVCVCVCVCVHVKEGGRKIHLATRLVHFYPLKQFQHCFKIVLSGVIVLCMRALHPPVVASERGHRLSLSLAPARVHVYVFMFVCV